MSIGSKLQMIVALVSVWYLATMRIFKLRSISEQEKLRLFTLSSKGISQRVLLPSSSYCSQQGLFKNSSQISFVYPSCFSRAPGRWSIFLLWKRDVTLGSRTGAYFRVGRLDWVLWPSFSHPSIDLFSLEGELCFENEVIIYRFQARCCK